MRRTTRIGSGALATAVLSGLLSGPVAAQQQEPYEPREERFAVAIGGGITDPGEATAPYLSAALRIRLGSRAANRSLAAYLEPEIGYWDDDGDRGIFRVEQSDLLVGLNVVGVARRARAEYSLGAGFGVHFLAAEVEVLGLSASEDTEALGVNAHFGVEVELSEGLGLFGVARIDVVDDDRGDTTVTEDVQAKGYAGIRLRF